MDSRPLSSAPPVTSMAPPVSSSTYDTTSSTYDTTSSTFDNQVLWNSNCLFLHYQNKHHLRLNLFVFVEQLCPICLTNQKNMAFGCGHQVYIYHHIFSSIISLHKQNIMLIFSMLFEFADMLRMWTGSTVMSDVSKFNSDQNQALLS